MLKLKLIFSALIATAPVLSLLPLAGCEDERVGVYAEEGYDYAPGYYYDEGYWDTYHHWHPRDYYYFDGHHWDHRDVVPHGFAAQDRHFNNGHFAGHEEHHGEVHEEVHDR